MILLLLQSSAFDMKLITAAETILTSEIKCKPTEINSMIMSILNHYFPQRRRKIDNWRNPNILTIEMLLFANTQR